MAISQTAIFEVRKNGSDTLNGGLFNVGATFNTNLAATSATGNSPVVTSATYNFVAGDVGAWVFISAGTNWTKGWYQIASVAANAATLKAAVGEAILYDATTKLPSGFNTVAGCATTASPTSGTWGVDYSQQDAAQFSLTGLTTSAANAIILTANASVNMIGNGLIITGGTNFTTGYYQINSVSAGVSITVDRTCTSAAGAVGTAGIGGSFASLGKAAPQMPGSVVSVAFVNYNATAYSITSASTNIADGCIAGVAGHKYCGYNTSRWLYNTDANRPTLKIGVNSATIFSGAVVYDVMNFILDGDNPNWTSSRGCNTRGDVWGCKFINFNNGAIIDNGASNRAVYCEITGCSSVTPLTLANEYCNVHDNTVTGINAIWNFRTISETNTGASSDGFGGATLRHCEGCIAYGNGRDGFRPTPANNVASFVNCVSENNGGVDYNNQGSGGSSIVLHKCGSYQTPSRLAVASNQIYADINPILGGSSFFTNAASGDFSLNSTANAGALLRALGFPTTFPGGLTANYSDVGAAQAAAAAGGGSYCF
jgi:hypothetical protein